MVGNTDGTTTQMYYLSNRCLDEFRQQFRWTLMQNEYNLVVSVPVVTTGDVSTNSAVITNIPSTTGIEANYWMVSGDTIPTAARVRSVDSATQVTMTMEATGTATGTALTFAKDTYPVPADFDWFNNQTMWDRTNHWSLLGPDSPQADQWHRSGIFTTGPRRNWRKLGALANTFRIWPQPAEIVSPLQLVFEYISLYAVARGGSLSAPAQYFTTDTDQPLLNDQAVIMGIQWMFWRAKGFNYVDMRNDWVDYVNRLGARDGGAPTLNLAKRINSLLISPSNIQDGNWPGTPQG